MSLPAFPPLRLVVRSPGISNSLLHDVTAHQQWVTLVFLPSHLTTEIFWLSQHLLSDIKLTGTHISV